MLTSKNNRRELLNAIQGKVFVKVSPFSFGTSFKIVTNSNVFSFNREKNYWIWIGHFGRRRDTGAPIVELRRKLEVTRVCWENAGTNKVFVIWLTKKTMGRSNSLKESRGRLSSLFEKRTLSLYLRDQLCCCCAVIYKNLLLVSTENVCWESPEASKWNVFSWVENNVRQCMCVHLCECVSVCPQGGDTKITPPRRSGMRWLILPPRQRAPRDACSACDKSVEVHAGMKSPARTQHKTNTQGCRSLSRSPRAARLTARHAEVQAPTL